MTARFGQFLESERLRVLPISFCQDALSLLIGLPIALHEFSFGGIDVELKVNTTDTQSCLGHPLVTDDITMSYWQQ